MCVYIYPFMHIPFSNLINLPIYCLQKLYIYLSNRVNISTPYITEIFFAWPPKFRN